MTITQTWNIVEINVRPLLDNLSSVVASLAFKVTTSDSVNTTEYVHTVVLGEPTQNSFIEYANLTEDQLLVWVKNYLGPFQVNQIETNGKYYIAEKSTPSVSSTAMPWGTV